MKRLKLCIAWHGLPFYAYQSLHALSQAGIFDLQILGSEAKGSIKDNPAAEELGVHWVDATRVDSFRGLGLKTPDILFKTSWHHPLFEALAGETRLSGGKVVALVDNIFVPRPRKLAGIIAGRLSISRRNDAVWVPGVCAAKYMRLMGFSPKRIFRGLYSTNEQLFSQGLSGRSSRALFVGRFEKEKNVRGLVDAWLQYKKGGGRLQELLLIGSGSVKIADAPGAGIRVRDWAPQHEVAKLMAESECFVLPSLCDHWGVVLLEAAMSGAVLISNLRCGAAYDLIEPDRNGIISKGTSARRLCEAFKRYDVVFADPALRTAAIGISHERAQFFTAQRFSETAERIAQMLI